MVLFVDVGSALVDLFDFFSQALGFEDFYFGAVAHDGGF